MTAQHNARLAEIRDRSTAIQAEYKAKITEELHQWELHNGGLRAVPDPRRIEFDKSIGRLDKLSSMNNSWLKIQIKRLVDTRFLAMRSWYIEHEYSLQARVTQYIGVLQLQCALDQTTTAISREEGSSRQLMCRRLVETEERRRAAFEERMLGSTREYLAYDREFSNAIEEQLIQYESFGLN